jgi:hypothetical protein
MEPLSVEEKRLEKEQRDYEARLITTVEYSIIAKDLLMQTVLGVQRCTFCGNQEPLEFFENGATCVHEEMLKRCGFCQSMAYCSEQCQRKDWDYHKILCASLSDKRADFKNDKVLMRKRFLSSSDDWFLERTPRDPHVFCTKTFSSLQHAVSFLLNSGSNEGNMSFIVSAMGQYPHNLDVQYHGLAGLSIILQPHASVLSRFLNGSVESSEHVLGEANRVLMSAGELGVIDILIFSMHTYSGKLRYQQTACMLLCLLLPGQKENAVIAANAGIFETLSGTVKRHLKDKLLVESTQTAYLYLLHNIHENRIIFGSVGGTVILHSIMKEYPTCKSILLRSLSAFSDVYKLNSDCSIAVGMSVIEVMNRFENCAEIQTTGCKALMNLLRFNVGPSLSQVVQTTVACMSNFPVNVSIQTDACRLLIILLLDAGSYLVFMDLGVVDVVANAVCRMKTESKFMLWGLKLLQRLSHNRLYAAKLRARSDLFLTLYELLNLSNSTRVCRFIVRLMKRMNEANE